MQYYKYSLIYWAVGLAVSILITEKYKLGTPTK